MTYDVIINIDCVSTQITQIFNTNLTVTMASDQERLEQLCTVLAEYYTSMSNKTYFQSTQEGKFKEVN